MTGADLGPRPGAAERGNWALAGLDRLRERGDFLQPESGQGDVELLHDAASPVSAFVRDCCRLDPAYQVPKDDLYRAYLRYLTEAGHTGRPAKSTFAQSTLCKSRTWKPFGTYPSFAG